MKKQRQLRPAIEDARLEDRVVLSHSGHIAAAQVHVMRADPHHARLPVATASEERATLNGIHSALVRFSHDTTASFNNVMAQLNAGTIDQTGAVDLLSGFGSIKFSQLFYNTETAAGHLPYGAGFNGFATTNPSTPSGLGVAELPSGGPSLFTLLAVGTPQNGFVSPIGTLQTNFFSPLSSTPPNLNAAGQAVSPSAIATTYHDSVNVVHQYIVDGVSAGDFRFKG